MKKLLLAGTLVVVILTSIFAAGCTTPTTSSPTPTPVTSSQNVSQYLSTILESRNVTMTVPFAFQPSLQGGMATYYGAAQQGNGMYTVSVQAWSNAQDAQVQFRSLRDTYVARGYAAVQQNTTMWLGFNSSARQGAGVEYGTSPLMPNYVILITGGAAGQAPFQETMMQNMWDIVHSPNASGAGIGPQMGIGVSASTVEAMQQEMQQHMGRDFTR